MTVLRRTGTLRTDLLRIARDPLLILLSLLPLALAVAVAATWQLLAPRLPAVLDVRLVTALLLLLTPMMFGFVYGLMLLDERDEGVLGAIAVTPPGKSGLLLLRMAAPAAWTVLASAAITLLVGRDAVPAARVPALALLAGAQAPLLALFLGAFAADKVQGIALAKVGSMLIGLGAIAALAPAPWRWLAAASPHFWLIELFTAQSGFAAYGVRLIAAATVHALALTLLARSYHRRAG